MKERLKYFPFADQVTPFYITLAGITLPDPDYCITRASSKTSVIEYVVRGEGFVRLGGREVSVGKDTVYFLPQGSAHEYASHRADPFEKIFLNVSGSFCSQLWSEYGLEGKHFFDGGAVKSVFEKIPGIIFSSLSDPEMQSALQGIFVEIVSHLSFASRASGHSEEALKLQTFLDSHLDRLVSAKELAGEIFRSPDYCQKLFLREFGLTPYAYQIHQKMKKAKALLLNTQMSIGEIAASLGYRDAHYFSNLFQTKCGIRPLEYRKS